MKSLLFVVGLSVLPGIAAAQGCYNCLTASSGTITYCCDSGTSFSTKHTWKVEKPGTLALSGTAFRIVFSDADFQYHLRWREKELSADGSLSVTQRRGVALATDRQDAGLALE